MKGRLEINRTTLQIIAYISMVIDHVAAVFISPMVTEDSSAMSSLYLILRVLGRFAFPIFAFLISEGVAYTHNRGKYVLRLLVLAVVSVIPYGLAFKTFPFVINVSDTNSLTNFVGKGSWSFLNNNVVFTLAIGAGMLSIILWIEENEAITNKIQKRIWQGGCVFLSMALAWGMGADYGLYGVGLILAFYMCRRNRTMIFPVCGAWMVAGYAAYAVTRLKPLDLAGSSSINIYALFSLFLIYLYNGKKSTNGGIVIPKALTYLFYPVHLLVLWALAT